MLQYLASYDIDDDGYSLIMVALWNRTDHYIFMLWFLSSFLA